MIRPTALLCVTMLCVIVLVAGCVSCIPYTVLKPINETNIKSTHGVDLSIRKVSSALKEGPGPGSVTLAFKNDSGPGDITFELVVTNIDLNDYTIKVDCIELKTLNDTILQPISTGDNDNRFLTYNHTNPGERIIGNVTFKVPENEYPSVLRYVDRDFSIEVFLMLENPTFTLTRFNGTAETVKILLADMGDATSIKNATWISGINNSQNVDNPPIQPGTVAWVIPAGRPAHLIATADVEFNGYVNPSMKIIDTWV